MVGLNEDIGLSTSQLSWQEEELGSLGLIVRVYRGLLHTAQIIVKKDPGRARQNGLATAGLNLTL